MSTSKLFSPLKVGTSSLQHRIVMAPLTRFRADDAHVPLPMVKEYYAQRASTPGTLLITEATFISPRAGGFPNVPGLYDPAQLESWKAVTDAVHAKGSYIYAQLWALGRAANPKVLNQDGYELVSASDLPMDENSPVPRPLTEDEIQQFIKDYAQAARNAVEIAGFDGVEIHGANGYLVDQFIQDVSNKRTDKWGGSVEDRSRFALEVTKAVTRAVGAERTGIRLSPFSTFQGMKMKDPVPQFSHLVKGLKDLELAYLHIVESRVSGNADVESMDKVDFIIDIWNNQSPIFLAGGYKPDSAKRALDNTYPDKAIAIVFGRYFISNPDLPFKVRNNIPLRKYNRDTFYNAKSPEGYIDYAFSKEFLESSESKL
ncbi:FMN-linked oxidoreductase [Patellaria atrata CBS 101060]|uniref:FMN-linked oxidoreductase n=1 Tax=Patellaria atrata CBS 101060 TaxID=1346257 RepID=A0A9P4SBP8_9PEZI|nr:FMN-linked oxidoreductase [Patellaria atrata CBS 101060]